MLTSGSSPQHCNNKRLEGAISRPLFAIAYEDADIIKVAVLLAVAISQSQAFVDGNKRTAVACMGMILTLNGYIFEGDPIQVAQHLEHIAANAESERDAVTREFEQWLHEHVTRP